ncbi:MAG: UDP-N-acetylglucosamine 1-carboxyvinyltransferase [Oscillospiraceae bacterium]|nr:UDP-N-acetylglucosamine 1-carboxyvinyltransferase [Oscillospiraceae bacterium]
MSAIVITGGKPLSGSVRVQGAKNSALPILAASVLNAGQSVVGNCPDLSDVDSSIRILRHLGCAAERAGDTVTVNASGMNRFDIPESLMREMRSSVVFLGAILSRAGEAVMSYPGGCDIGPRPIDLHLSALRQMGAEICEEGGFLRCKVKEFTGCGIHLPLPSVGATENIMLAAARARGTTRIFNAAREPEIADLQNYLNAAGGRVSGAGSSTIDVEGVPELRGTEHRVIPDRIVTATLLSAAAAAGGEVTLTDACPLDASAVISVLTDAGCEITARGTELRASRRGTLRAMGRVRTMPHPGFPTDAQALVMAAACRADGVTVFSEKIFQNRYQHAMELLRMGADIQIEGEVAVVRGVPKLYGARVCSTDLRGGAALAVAALAAEGETELSGLEHIDRGYEKFEAMLAALGADIKRV